MTDRTANVTYTTRARAGRTSFPMADGVTIGIGALVQTQAGYLNHWDQTGEFQGLLIGGKARAGDAILIGETSDTPPPEGFVDSSGVTITGLTIAGTPTQAKVGDYVYCADSDLASVTLAVTGSQPVGWMSRYTSATNQDLTLFTPEEAKASLGSIYNMTWQFDLADIADGDLVTDLILGHAFEVVESYFVVTEAVTTASKLTTISMDIGAVAITNGAHALTSANCTPAGVKVQNTGALTVNTGSATDTLTIKAASTTAFSEGKGSLVIRIRAL